MALTPPDVDGGYAGRGAAMTSGGDRAHRPSHDTPQALPLGLICRFLQKLLVASIGAGCSRSHRTHCGTWGLAGKAIPCPPERALMRKIRQALPLKSEVCLRAEQAMGSAWRRPQSELHHHSVRS